MSAAAGVNLSEDLDLSDIEDIFSAFPIEIQSQYNAGLSSKFLYLCKEKMNVRVVSTLLAEVNPEQEMLKILLTTITPHDLSAARSDFNNQII